LAQHTLLTISIISITMFMVCVNVYYVYLLEVCIICTSLYQQTSPVLEEEFNDTKGGYQNP
jgi:uncharacterized membrane protein (DUF373 family)